MLLLPVGYMMADLAENVALARMLGGAPEAITSAKVTFAQALTLVKHGLVIAGTLQVIYLCVCWVMRG